MLVGIIDGGIVVLHEAFRDSSGHTRLVAVWDQTDPTGPTPSLQGRASYGTLHTQAQIDGYIAAGAVPAALTRDREGHGTHVAVAAGRARQPFAGGVAP